VVKEHDLSILDFTGKRRGMSIKNEPPNALGATSL
jgi:hypothetical protein